MFDTLKISQEFRFIFINEQEKQDINSDLYELKQAKISNMIMHSSI